MSTGLIDQAMNYLADNDTREHQSLRTGGGVNAYKRNGIVTIIVYINPISLSTSYTNIGTLPVGWRPSTTIYTGGMQLSADITMLSTFAISTDGSILVRRASGSGNMQIGTCISFVVA